MKNKGLFVWVGIVAIAAILLILALAQVGQNRAAGGLGTGTPRPTGVVANINPTGQPTQPPAPKAEAAQAQAGQAQAQGGNIQQDDRVVVNDTAPVTIKPALTAFRRLPHVSTKRESPYQCSTYQTPQGVLTLKPQALTVHTDPGAYVEEHICTSTFKADADTENYRGQWRAVTLLPWEADRPQGTIPRGGEYVSQKKDTAGTVAYRAGVPIEWLMAANEEKTKEEADELKPGTKLKIPTAAPSTTLPAAPYGWDYDKPTAVPGSAPAATAAPKAAPTGFVIPKP